MKVYEIRNEKNGTKVIEKDLSAVIAWVEQLYWNDELIVTIKDMDSKEYEQLPEFKGF